MNSKPTISIKFLPKNQVVEASHDETILEVGLRENVGIPTSCGGYGTCTACRVWVVEGLHSLPPRNEIEREMAEERGFSEQERLSCQIHPVEGLVLKIPGDDSED